MSSASRVCVPVSRIPELDLATDAGAEGVVLLGDDTLASHAHRAGLEVVALRVPVAPPYERLSDAVSSGLAPSLIIVDAPKPMPEDLLSIERVKSFCDRVVDALARIGEWAGERGHRVGVPSRVDSFYSGSLELTEAIRAARSAHVHWVLNTFDAVRCGDGLSGATDIGIDILAHVVAEDVRAGERVAPGEGTVEWVRLFEQLEPLGYVGAIEVGGPVESWPRSLAVLKAARG